MNRNLTWQIVLALCGLGLVATILFTGRSRPAAPAQPESVTLPAAAALGTGIECADPAALQGGLFTEGAVGRPSYLNPLLADANPVDRQLVPLIFAGLTRLDSQGQVVPDLAESWEVGEDRLSVTFTLRPDALWHDGVPVTADDVLFTVGLLQADGINERLPDGPLWRSLTAEKIDERQVRFTLVVPYAPFLEAASRGLLPAHVLAGVSAAELADHPFNRRPLGSGPFRVENSWSEEGFLLLRPQPAFWPAPPLLDGVQIRFYADQAALIAALASGEIEGMIATAAMLPDVLAVPGSRLFTGYRAIYDQLIFNLSGSGAPAVRDLAVRQALTHGLDKQALVDEVMSGQGIPFAGPYLPNTWAYDPFLPRTYAYDPETAARLLDAAGWAPPAAGSGPRIRVSDAGEEELVLTLLAPDEGPAAALADRLAESWRSLGIEIVVETVAVTTYRERLAAREFDLVLVEIKTPDDPDLYDFWSQEAIVRGQNYAGWNNRRASEALEAGRQIWNQDERRQYYQAFLRFYDEDLPAVTLFQHVYNFAVGDTIQGVSIGPIHNEWDRYDAFHTWFKLSENPAGDCQEPQP